jgi:hypothetical protein
LHVDALFFQFIENGLGIAVESPLMSFHVIHVLEVSVAGTALVFLGEHR